MSVIVTGATGHLGRLAVEALLDQGTPAGEIIAAVRDPAGAADLAAAGVEVRHADYEDADSLRNAFIDADRLLLVSSNAVGRRVLQHRNVIDAARTAGVSLLAYTSIAKADSATIQLAADHRETETLIRASGLPFVFLRNSWYLENYSAQLAPTLEHGALLGSAGNGRVSAATRADYAAAAAAVLTGPGHENAVYELGGDVSFTLTDLAAAISEQSGREIVYRNLPLEEYVQVLIGAGLPEASARVYADSDRGVARGELFVDTGDLHRLIGRAPTPYTDAIAAALQDLMAERR